MEHTYCLFCGVKSTFSYYNKQQRKAELQLTDKKKNNKSKKKKKSVTTDDDSSSSSSGGGVWYSWKSEVGASICTLLSLSSTDSQDEYLNIFSNGSYCNSCAHLVWNANLMLKQLHNLESQLNVIQGQLEKNLGVHLNVLSGIIQGFGGGKGAGKDHKNEQQQGQGKGEAPESVHTNEADKNTKKLYIRKYRIVKKICKELEERKTLIGDADTTTKCIKNGGSINVSASVRIPGYETIHSFSASTAWDSESEFLDVEPDFESYQEDEEEVDMKYFPLLPTTTTCEEPLFKSTTKLCIPHLIKSNSNLKKKKKTSSKTPTSITKLPKQPKLAPLTPAELTCRECQLQLTSRHALLDHIRALHKDVKYPCTIIGCSRHFKTQVTLDSHLKNEHCTDKYQLFCPICTKGCSSKEELDSHNQHHSSSATPFSCLTCSYLCSNSTDLKKHVREHDNPYKCSTCTKCYATEQGLNLHAQIHIKRFSCETCGLGFYNSGALNHHRRIHSDARNFACSQCNAKFKDASALRRHGMGHTGQKGFNCSICNKAFNNGQALKIHEETHSGLKSYVCIKCGKAFTSRNNLKQHEQTHAATTVAACVGGNNKIKRKRIRKSQDKKSTTNNTKDSGGEWVIPDEMSTQQHQQQHDGGLLVQNQIGIPEEFHQDVSQQIILSQQVQQRQGIVINN